MTISLEPYGMRSILMGVSAEYIAVKKRPTIHYNLHYIFIFDFRLILLDRITFVVNLKVNIQFCIE